MPWEHKAGCLLASVAFPLFSPRLCVVETVPGACKAVKSTTWNQVLTRLPHATHLMKDIRQVPRPSVVIQVPTDLEKDQPCKKIIFKQNKGVGNLESARQTPDIGVDDGFGKTKKITELANLETPRKQQNQFYADEIKKGKATDGKKFWKGEIKRNRESIAEERTRRLLEEERHIQEHQRILEIRRHEEAKELEEQQKAKKKKKKKKKTDFQDECTEEYRSNRNGRRIPERDRAAKRRPIVDLGHHVAEYAPPTKRRRGGEVLLSNNLLSIVDTLRECDVSYVFLKPVSKKEAPDYFDIITHPMDLSTIKESEENGVQKQGGLQA